MYKVGIIAGELLVFWFITTIFKDEYVKWRAEAKRRGLTMRSYAWWSLKDFFRPDPKNEEVDQDAKRTN